VGYVAHAQSSDIGFLPRSELIHDDEAADYGSRYEIIIRCRLYIPAHFVCAETFSLKVGLLLCDVQMFT